MIRTVLLFTMLIAASALQQQHVEPAEGWLCDNRAKTPADHACACHRTCEWDPVTKTVVEKEDTACKVYCWRSHCACLSECDSQ